MFFSMCWKTIFQKQYFMKNIEQLSVSYKNPNTHIEQDMTIYLICLEQCTKRDITGLEKKILQLGSVTNSPLKKMWLIQSDLNAEEIRDQLLTYVHAKDSLLVIRIDADHWASWNVHKNTALWLNQASIKTA